MTAVASPRKLAWLMSFTGLIPLALTLPLLLLHLWMLGIAVSAVSKSVVSPLGAVQIAAVRGDEQAPHRLTQVTSRT